MKGYKAFDQYLRCGMYTYGPGMQYEIDATYKYIDTSHPIELCRSGYHFCSTLWCVYKWYPEHFATRVCEVEASGNILNSPDGCKSVTDTIHVVRELPPEEILATMCDDYTTAPYEDKQRMVSILSNIMTTIDQVSAFRINKTMRAMHVISESRELKALQPPSDRTLERIDKWLDALINPTDHELVLKACRLANTAEQYLRELQL